MQNLKTIFFLFPLMVIGSFKAQADLPLPMANAENNWLSTLTEQNSLLTGETLLFDVFVLWVAYIVFCLSKNKLKKQ